MLVMNVLTLIILDQLDVDDDGIGNVCDNCIFIENTDQLDVDNDQVEMLVISVLIIMTLIN